MTKILIIGAGRSATSLIEYLTAQAPAHQWQLTIADSDEALAVRKAAGHTHVRGIGFDIRDKEKRQALIREHDFVISMLPAFMHGDVARDCVAFQKHMATASYVSPEMKALHGEAQAKRLLLLNECGLDPGLDHASAMKVIDEIRDQGASLVSFKSYCGGLVAPESNDNPWGYKFSWNPRNVILAGQGTAQYLEEGKIRFIPYNRLYRQISQIDLGSNGTFDAYANRDSISYREVYGLESVSTMLRGTLRQKGYCMAWDIFVRLGWTDDTSKISDASSLTYTELLEAFLPAGPGSVKERLQAFAGQDWNEDLEEKFDYLELFSAKRIPLQEGTPAQLLQALLEEKWALKETDKDMIVMQHQFGYRQPGRQEILYRESSLVVTGKDQQHTAMAQTVGLPLAITVKNFLTGGFERYGVQIPIHRDMYDPLLSELETFNIRFTEK
jgi:saccharopine dehydrogenase-like NADP-dependent oxidoreductase